MSNKKHAAETIYKTLSGQYGDFCIPTDAAQALEEAGLLMPDLPQPDELGISGKYDMAEWLPLGTGLENPIVWTAFGAGRVMIQRIEPGQLTPGEAREVAHALLAAANYAEQEKK